MAGTSLLIKKRLLFILISFSLILVALLLRVAWIQLIDGNYYKKLAFEQQTTGRLISPRRGIIYDTNGNELAISASVETVTINPKLIREWCLKEGVTTQTVSDELSKTLELKSEDVLKKINKKTNYETIKAKIDKEVGTEIRKWAEKLKIDGVYIDEDSKRFYPNRNLAAHVLGFTSIDNQGIEGIEAVMDSYLKGKPGKILNGMDAKNHELPYGNEMHIDPQDGQNVVLTIDETIQFFAQKALQKAVTDNEVLNGASAIVMDPRNGDILALVSNPDFDPNTPRAAPTGIDDATWQSMSSDDKMKKLLLAWRDKAVADTYEPGSTFKAITAAAGLEENVVNPESPTSDFPIKVPGWPKPLSCWRDYRPHGNETFKEGLYNSCNPVFVKVSQSLGIDRFYSYVRSFGFYNRTGIGLPGEAYSEIHKNPKEIDMATASFGQSFNITPIQLITAYSAIANGGKLMKPRIVKEITDSEGNIVKKYEPEFVRNVISKQTSETLRTLLEGVVSVPTATGGNAYVKGYRVAGKTGTSQTLPRGNGRYIASFSAFAPADNPVLCVLVILDYPTGPFGHGGGTIAAPIVREIIESSLDYLGVERRYTEEDKQKMEQMVYIPDVRGKKMSDARKELALYDIGYKVEGEGYTNDTIVVDQTPKPDVSLPKKSVVILYTYKPDHQEMVKIPDLKDKTISEATAALARVGLNIKVNGIGTAIQQQSEVGKEVEKGGVVEVEFRFLDTE